MATQPGETPSPDPSLPEQDVPVREPGRAPVQPGQPPRQPGEVDNPDLPGQDLPR